MIKVGLVGIGGYAGMYVRNLLELQQSGKCCLAAAAVRPKDDIPEVSARLRSEGVRIYPGALEMMEAEKELDLVALPVGIGSHCPLTLEALKRRSNVLVEKPAAGSVAEIRQMMAAENGSPGFAAVGFQHLYMDSTMDLKKILLSGKYGAVKKIAVIGIAPRADVYYNRNEWVCRMKGPSGEMICDSPINNAFAHYLNLALFWAGSTPESSARIRALNGELYRARRSIETFDSCAVRFYTENDVEILTLFAHTSDQTVDQTLRLECEKGTVLWNVSGSWVIRDPEGNICEESSKPVLTAQQEMFRNVLGAVAGEKKFLCSLHNALEHTYCIEKLHEHFTVHCIPDEYISIRESDGLHIVKELAEDFTDAFRKNLLLGENGVPWAQEAKTVYL